MSNPKKKKKTEATVRPSMTPAEYSAGEDFLADT